MLSIVLSVFDITVKDLSYFTKIPVSTLSSYNNEVSIPSKENLKKLCDFFGLRERFFIEKGVNYNEHNEIWEAKKQFAFNNFGRDDEDGCSIKISYLLNKRKEIMDKIDVLNSKHMEYINKLMYCLENQQDDNCKQLLSCLDEFKINNEDINIIYQEYIYRIKDKDLEKFKERKEEIQEWLKQPKYNTNKLMMIRFNKKIDEYKKGYYFYIDGCKHNGWSIVNRLNSIITDKYDSEYKHIIKVNWQHNNKFSDRITLFKDGKNDYAEILEDWSVV